MISKLINKNHNFGQNAHGETLKGKLEQEGGFIFLELLENSLHQKIQ